MKHRLRALSFGALAVSSLVSPLAQSQTAILAATDGSNQAIVFPNVSFTGSCPATVTQIPVTGISGRPHGVGYYGSDFALISNFSASNVFNVQISTHTVLNTIATGSAGYNGTGTIAIAPSLQYALASGGANAVLVMQAPFTSPTLTSTPLPGSIAGYQTEAIVFDASNRAYIGNSAGISVLDPPYTSVAFTIPIGRVESLAITPNGNTLLATDLGSTVRIVTGPFSASSTAVTLSPPGASGLDGITVTPDGSRALAVSASQATLFSIAAPYSATSTVDAIPLPGVGSLEDVSVSADGNFAMATGNAQGNLAPIVRAPFTTAGATVCSTTITGGRGAGAVRFLPVALQPPIGPPPPLLPVPTLSQWALIALGVLLALTSYVTLRRRGH